MKLKEGKLAPVVSKAAEEIKSTGFISRIKNSFFAADMNNIGEYLLENVIVPSCKDLASNVVDSVLGNVISMKDILIYGEAKSRTKQAKRTNYTNAFRGGASTSSATSTNSSTIIRSSSIHAGGKYDFSANTFEYLDEAKAILLELSDILEEYDAVTVANFCDLAMIQTKPVDYKWGWRNLSSAKVRPINGRWYIDMPKPVYLE